MSDLKPNLGDCLKILRQDKGWTLSQVSQMSGLAISTLSKVENKQMSLTYDKLLQLAEGLNVDIAELFEVKKARAPSQVSAARAVGRLGHGRVIETAKHAYRFVCTELSHKEMIPILGTISLQSEDGIQEFIRHPGQKFIYVLEGQIELRTKVYETLRLEAGESVYFESAMDHAYVGTGDRPARILCVCTATAGQSEHDMIERQVAET